MTIYIVEGSTGEYSDRREWSVKAFRSQEKAEAYVTLCEAWLREHRVNDDNFGIDRYELMGKNPHDPNMQIDYTGTRYYYYEVELVED